MISTLGISCCKPNWTIGGRWEEEEENKRWSDEAGDDGFKIPSRSSWSKNPGGAASPGGGRTALVVCCGACFFDLLLGVDGCEGGSGEDERGGYSAGGFLAVPFFDAAFCLPCLLPFDCSAVAVPFADFLVGRCLAWAMACLDGEAVVVKASSCLILEPDPEDEITSGAGFAERAFWPEADFVFELDSSCLGGPFFASIFFTVLDSFRCFDLPLLSASLALLWSAWAT